MIPSSKNVFNILQLKTKHLEDSPLQTGRGNVIPPLPTQICKLFRDKMGVVYILVAMNTPRISPDHYRN